jgi:hypothetical protein
MRLPDFDPETHRYSIDGRPLPGVTSILKAVGIYVPPPMSDEDREFYLARGKAVHAACELLDAGTLDEDSVDPAIAGRVDAYRAFRAQESFRRVGSELRVGSDCYRFAGTPDLLGWISGEFAIIDLKSAAAPDRATAIQCAAYAKAWEECHLLHGCDTGRVERTYSLNLRDGGTFRLTRLDKLEPNAWQVFLAALTVYNWRQRNGR